MKVRRRGVGVPEQLRVVVGVGVHEPGGDDLTGGVELGLGGAIDIADAHDASVLDGDVADIARRAGAVDDGSATNQMIEVSHACRLVRCPKSDEVSDPGERQPHLN